MIAIKSMKKVPYCCSKCRFYEKGGYYTGWDGFMASHGPYCHAMTPGNIAGITVTRERMKNCPLIEIETEADI